MASETYASEKCRFVTMRLECLVGGEGTIECLDSEFHADCPHRKKADDDNEL